VNYTNEYGEKRLTFVNAESDTDASKKFIAANPSCIVTEVHSKGYGAITAWKADNR